MSNTELSSETPLPSTLTRGRFAYVGALDGLRALSVLAVMAFHAGVATVPGGFLGVDIFFVLSGFLITTLLLREQISTQTIAFAKFWGRRVRRLAPALLMVLVATSVFVDLIATPGLFPTLRGDLWASLGYVLNWRLVAAKSSYFVAGLPSSPLTHLWSLAIEEQFYLLWPLAIWVLTRRRGATTTVATVSVVGALASSAWMAWLFVHHANTTRLYYGTDTHVTGLLLGAALGAFLVNRSGLLEGSRGRALDLVGACGAVGLAVAIFTASGTSPWLYQGGFLLLAVATVAVIAMVLLRPSGPAAQLLSWSPLRFVGRISYGLYLWHYPIFLWCNAQRTGWHGVTLLAVRFVVTFIVATVSYYAVERPIRAGMARHRVTPKLMWVGAMSATLALCLVLVGLAAEPAAPTPPSHVTLDHPLRTLIVGDSVAFSITWFGGPWAAKDNVVVYSGAIPGCGLMPFTWANHHGGELFAAGKCRHAPLSLKGYLTFWSSLISLHHPDVVVILAGRFEEHTLFRHGYLTSIEQRAFRHELEQRMIAAETVAGAGGARVVWSTSPCSNSGEAQDGSPWIEDNARRLRLYNDLVVKVARADHRRLFDLNHLVCPSGQFQRVIDGVVVRSPDGVHFSPTGAPWVVHQLDLFLKRANATS